jgi:hypothetical protein
MMVRLIIVAPASRTPIRTAASSGNPPTHSGCRPTLSLFLSLFLPLPHRRQTSPPVESRVTVYSHRKGMEPEAIATSRSLGECVR